MKKLTRALPLALFAGIFAGCGGGGGFGGITPPPGGGGDLSWTRAAYPASASEPAAEVLFTAPNGTVYFGNQDGLYSTNNRGQSWNRVNVGNAGSTAQSLGVNAAGELLAGIGQQAFRQTGGSWQQSTGITSTLKVSGFTLDSSGAVIAVTAWTGEVWRSTDNGSSYTKVSGNPAAGLPGTVGALWVIKKGPDGTLYTGGEDSAGIFRSTDNGSTWQPFGLSSDEGYSGNLRGISFNRLGDVLANRLLGGQPIHRYTGGHWVVASQGIPNSDQAADILMSSSGRMYTGTFRSRGNNVFTGKVYSSTNDGQSWAPAANGLPDVGISRLTMTKDGYLIAACADGSVYRSNAPVP